MKRLVLDNMIVNHLVQPPDPPEPDYRGARQLLEARVQSRRLGVLGSIPLLEEVIGTHRRLPEKATQMYDFYHRLTRGEFLKPWNDRARQELDKGSALTQPESLLELSVPRSLDKLNVRAVNKEVYKVKKEFERTWRDTVEQVRERSAQLRVAKGGGFPEEEGLDEFFRQLPDFINSEVRNAFSKTYRSIADIPDLKALPSFYAFQLFIYTKVYQSLRDGLKFSQGDWHDLSHFVDAWTADCLATDDRKLIRTCDRIREIEVLPFNILQSGDFIALLRA